jgi:phosphoribosylanthranilate isomerase
MPLEAKICGVNAPDALQAAVQFGARWVGFVFYPRSPRHLSLAAAAALAESVPAGLGRVGLLVDPDDAGIAELLAQVPLELLQLHGRESPERVAAIRARFGRPVMKVIAVASAADVRAARLYESAADRLLFDAKPPPDMAGALPGGNAIAFDWRLLGGQAWRVPWMLSGGLNAGNLADAVRLSGARAVDVSSGVESRPGAKDPAKIRAFLELAATL